MNIKSSILIALFFIGINSSIAQNISVYQRRLVNNWQFLREDVGGIWEQ